VASPKITRPLEAHEGEHGSELISPNADQKTLFPRHTLSCVTFEYPPHSQGAFLGEKTL